MASQPKTVTLKNVTEGPKGFHAVGGHQMLDPGQSASAELSDGELAIVKQNGWFEVSTGDKAAAESQDAQVDKR